MQINKKIYLDLVYCYRQINLCYKKTILSVEDYPPKGGFCVLSLNGKYYITDDYNLLENNNIKIEKFLEDFYYKIYKSEIIVYPVKVINNQIIRFDGLLFCIYDNISRKPNLVEWNKIDPALRSQYFERVLSDV